MPYYSQLVISWLSQAVGRSMKKWCVEHLSSLSLKYLLHSHTLPVFYIDGPVPKSQFSLLRAKRHDCPRQLACPSLGASGVSAPPSDGASISLHWAASYCVLKWGWLRHQGSYSEDGTLFSGDNSLLKASLYARGLIPASENGEVLAMVIKTV